MITLSHRVTADRMARSSRSNYAQVLPPASGFWHDGRLNMGPAILLALGLSLISWAGIIGTGYIIL